jgi:hypothetical protein
VEPGGVGAGGVTSGGVGAGVTSDGAGAGGVVGGGACAITKPRGLAAEGDGAGVAGSPTDAGVISSPGSFGHCIARRASEAGGISGVAGGVVAAGIVSCGGPCAITRPAASMDKAVEIAEVPSSRPKRRELDMMDPQMPDLDQVLDPHDRGRADAQADRAQAVSTVHSPNGMGDAAGSGRYVRRGEDRVR